jgi:putative spermidine/putrescine transport system permease protein
MFISNFLYSVLWAVLTIIVGILLLVPTATLIRLRVPKMRSVVEFITLLPFVIPAIVFVFGLVRTFSQPPLLIVNSPAVLVAGYLVLAMPYMYRAVDTGLRSIDVKTLTEAGQSLGAGWGRILFDIILPNIRVAILSGSFLTFAIVIGELVLASYLAKPAFAPYMAYMIQQKAYEPAAMAIVSFALTWGALGIIGGGH